MTRLEVDVEEQRPMQAQRPLEGVKVLDAGTMIAAPWAATFLSEFGADVIKIERPIVGDQMRRYGGVKNGGSVLWSSLARNKRSITLDLKQPEGVALFKKLAQTADIVIENFRPGTLEKWGIGWNVLHELNPRLILLRVTGYGQTGPYRMRAGFGSIMESFAGFAYMTGHKGGPPTIPPVPLADGSTGIMGAFALMVALYWRDQRGGTGQVIDLSLYESLLKLEEPRLLDWAVMRKSTVRNGNRLEDGAPRNTFECGDGEWITLSGSTQETALRVFDTISRPDLKTDPKFSTNAARLQNNDELEDLIREWICQRPREEVLRQFADHGVAAAAIYDLPSLFVDEHVRERRTFVEVEDPCIGRFEVLNVVPRLSETPGEIRSTGPALGADNAAVYQELGLTSEELSKLSEQHVI